MAPKREQAVVTTTTVLNGLSSTEPALQVQALNQLAAANAFSQAEVLQFGIPAKLISLLQQPDKAVKLLACRQLAVYAATTGPLQQATACWNALQALWSELSTYHAAEAAIADALAEPTAAKAAQPKKQQAAKDIVDPDEWLPGPSKYLLDACLRTVSSLLSGITNSQPQLQDQSAVASAAAAEPTAAVGAGHMRAWVAEQDVQVLVCLIRHPSAKVQMRACRLAHQLTNEPSWADAFAAAGGAAAASTIGAISTPSTPALQLTALRLLVRLTDVSIAAAAFIVADTMQVNALVTQILQAGAIPVSQGKCKAAASVTDAGKLVHTEVTAVQLAVADLLALMCCKSSSMSQHLVESGGMAALQALLPEPPAPPLTAEEVAMKCGLSSIQGDADGTKSPCKHANSKQPTPRAVGDAAQQTPPRTPVASATDAKHGTPRGATSAAGSAARSAPHTPDTPHAAADEAAAGQDTAELLVPDSFPLPAAKTAAPELQARVLRIIAAVLQQEGMVQSLLLQPLQGQAGLLRVLLHMFAPEPTPAQPAAAAGESSDAAQLAAGADGFGHATAAAGVAGRAASPTKPAASIAAPAKGAAPAAGGRKSGVGAAEMAGTAATGGTTPRKGAGKAAAGTACKEVPKSAEPLAVLDPLAPPYSGITKAAALDCLAQLVQDKQAVALLAAQQVPAMHRSNPSLLVFESALSASGAAAALQECRAEAGTPMLQQMLEDLQLLSTPQNPVAEAMLSSNGGSSNTAAKAPGQPEDVAKGCQASAAVQPELDTMLERAAAVLAGLAEHLTKQQLLEVPLLPALKALARCGHNQPASLHAHQAIARALLLLPEACYVPAARPPLPSPPATPPAPPLPTSQFAWDALDRPLITDGAVLMSNA